MNRPKIGPRQLVYEDPYSRFYRVIADFGDRTEEYFIRDGGKRAGVVAHRQDSLLLVRQYRFLINGLSWEIPGGGIFDEETPETAVVRECLEETGFRCLDLRPLIFYHTSLDSVENPNHIFRCDQVAEDQELHRVQKEEVHGYEWVPRERCVEMIVRGEILDHFSIIAILADRASEDEALPGLT